MPLGERARFREQACLSGRQALHDGQAPALDNRNFLEVERKPPLCIALALKWRRSLETANLPRVGKLYAGLLVQFGSAME
jgi:hypothetical protein